MNAQPIEHATEVEDMREACAYLRARMSLPHAPTPTLERDPFAHALLIKDLADAYPDTGRIVRAAIDHAMKVEEEGYTGEVFDLLHMRREDGECIGHVWGWRTPHSKAYARLFCKACRD